MIPMSIFNDARSCHADQLQGNARMDRTKAIVFVDMCGQPCDFDEIKTIADKHKLILIQDAAHSIGAIYKDRKVGSYADITCFSFHQLRILRRVKVE